jgi:hypothetical protein
VIRDREGIRMRSIASCSLLCNDEEIRGFESASELYRLTTAAVRPILVSTFADRGVSRDKHGGTPTAVNLNFVDWSRYLFFQVPPHLCSRG